jgi:hypothetical protein
MLWPYANYLVTGTKSRVHERLCEVRERGIYRWDITETANQLGGQHVAGSGREAPECVERYRPDFFSER